MCALLGTVVAVRTGRARRDTHGSGRVGAATSSVPPAPLSCQAYDSGSNLSLCGRKRFRPAAGVAGSVRRKRELGQGQGQGQGRRRRQGQDGPCRDDRIQVVERQIRRKSAPSAPYGEQADGEHLTMNTTGAFA
ncbi:hypothetical protein GCM10010406_14720 [Streptomyces thermolineatus]|uniref:Uncharacterized protein n=1 Tax=Streptomyces thermolineatus TaxID=44033 RepID=A0ABN3L8P9_9ACTN